MWGAGNDATDKRNDARKLKHIGLLARCDVFRLIESLERGARRMVWQAIEDEVQRERMLGRLRDRNSSKAFARGSATRRVRSVQCARRYRGSRRLLPPSDGFPAVVASAARAVCADRAMSRGLPRRSTKFRLPSSLMALSFAATSQRMSSNRSCRHRTTFFAHAGRQYSGTRIKVG